MLRSLIFGFAIVTSAARAQTGTPNPQPMQPGPPSMQPAADPNAVPLAPPSFVPDLNGSDTPTHSRPRAVRISSGVMAGLLLTKTDPVYPVAAQGIQGSVVMSAHVGKDGRVASLAVVSGPHVLQAAALNAARRWTYRPYLLDGEPIDVFTTITIDFSGR